MKSLKLLIEKCIVPVIAIESYTTMSWRLVKPNEFGLWHDCLGHPRATMMRRIISNSRGYLLTNRKVLLSKDYSYETCSQGNLITRPSMTKVDIESSSFLQGIQGDIYGLIHLANRLFKYFMVLVDASSIWSYIFPVMHAQHRFCTFTCVNNKAPIIFSWIPHKEHKDG